MFTPEIPITDHPALPDAVPLVAGFHDDRNRLSYYHPRLTALDAVTTPETKFFTVTGGTDSIPACEYREITKFMQDINTQSAFMRGDFSSGKLSREARVIDSQDPTKIEHTFSMLVQNLIKTGRHLGGRIAVREFIPHDVEIRYFIENGDTGGVSVTKDNRRNAESDTLSVDSLTLPGNQISSITESFDSLAWSVDFIRHDETGEWYCVDMGLDGLYYNTDSNEWVSISEHELPANSPAYHTESMPDPDRFSYVK